ncbi:MAG: hypothetical protein WCC69_09040 [Pirellulales bacterium]
MHTSRPLLDRLLSVLLCCCIAASAAADEPVSRRRAYADYVGGKVAIVAGDGTVEWEYGPAPKVCFCRQLPGGNILFCDATGPKEVSPDKKIVWQYKPQGAICHNLEKFADGRVLAAESIQSRLIEIGLDGQVAKTIPVQLKFLKPITSHQFRGVRRSADGHYWICPMDERKVVECAADGTVLRELPMPGCACESLALPNGNLLVCMWSPGRVIEFDKDMKIVWEIRTDELPGNPLRIPYCIERLPDGNTVVGNSLIQGHIGKQPQAFEVTPDKKVVWELTDHARFKNVAYLHTLDVGK